MDYVIPANGARHLVIGKWVEIFKAYCAGREDSSIRVQSMRIDGRIIGFGNRRVGPRGSKEIRPHEGKIVAISHDDRETRFRIRLNS